MTARSRPLGIAAAVVFGLVACVSDAGSQRPAPEPMVGVKIYAHEGGFDDLFAEWATLGINTAFISETLASDPTFRDLADSRGIDTFLIAPVFFDPAALAEDPDLFAITAEGARARDDWVQFVCPSRRGYRERRVGEISELVRRLRPEGLSLDFIRHFVFWEMVHPETSAESLPNTCFCPHCLASFGTETGIRPPAGLTSTREMAAWILVHHETQWTEWKVRLITSMAQEIVQRARSVDPELRVNLHAVPWRGQDYAGAIRRVAGQDFASLSAFADYLSPMAYSFMLRRPPEWIHSVVRDLSASSAVKIVPSIQVRESYREDERFDAEEFTRCLSGALKPPSQGVVFWSWEALAQEPEKRRAIRRLLGR